MLINFTNLMYLFILFWLSSFIGWVIEVIVCSISDKKIVNRGFLIGPYCPIYGCGALVMMSISKYSDNLFVFFILSMVLCSFLEYFVSYIMEIMFQIRWWDYSNDSFNINGRICLRNALAFGALGVIFVRYIKPWYYGYIIQLNENVLLILSIFILIVTVIDIFISFNAMSKIKNIIEKNINKYRNVDATSDIKKLVNRQIPGVNFIHKRLITTYHLLDKEKEYLKKTIKKVNEKTKSGYGLFLLFIVIGVIIGLVLSIGFGFGTYKIIIPFSISICLLFSFIIVKVRNK